MSEGARCAFCRRPLAVRPGPGRPPRYCRRSHRQRAYEARRRASEASLAPGLLIVSQSEVDRLHDRLYALEAALDDVTSDLAGSAPGVRDLAAALAHLRAAAEDLRGLVLEPVTA